MKRGILMIGILMVAILIGCEGDTKIDIYGDNNCVPLFEANTGNIVMECFTGPTTSEIECYSPGGTRLHPSECEGGGEE